MEKESTRHELIDIYKIFNDSEFSSVWEATGGHGGSISMISSYFCDSKESGINNAIALVQKITGTMLHNNLLSAPDGTMEFLKELTNNNFIMKQRELSHIHRYLVENNIIFTEYEEGNYVIYSQYKMMSKAIEQEVGEYSQLE